MHTFCPFTRCCCCCHFACLLFLLSAHLFVRWPFVARSNAAVFLGGTHHWSVGWPTQNNNNVWQDFHSWADNAHDILIVAIGAARKTEQRILEDTECVRVCVA